MGMLLEFTRIQIQNPEISVALTSELNHPGHEIFDNNGTIGVMANHTAEH